jgi:cell division septal protein FtsQ
VRRFWIVAFVLLAFAVWGASRIIALPTFRATSIGVFGLSNDSHVSRADVLSRAAIDARGNVWLLDRGAIERRIEAIPYVATAHVGVRPPAAVTLDVRERTIDGCVRDGAGRIATIDADRRVLAERCDGPSAPLYELHAPLDARAGTYVQNSELIALQNDRRVLAAGDSYRSFAHDAFGELEATLRDGIVVKFGDDDDLDRKQRLVGPILAQVGGERRPIGALDLRAPATPVVEYRPEFGALKPVHPHPLNKL